MRRYAIIGALIGASLPIIWLASLKLVGEEAVARAMLSMPWSNALLIMAWPSSLLLLASPERLGVSVFLLSLVINAGLYALLASLIYVGRKGARSLLIAVVLLVLAGWYALLRMYFG